MSAPYEYQSEDSDVDFQPKRIKIDLNKQPIKSCMKKAAPPPEPSESNERASDENYGYDDDEHLLDSDNDYQGYDDNGFNQAEQDRYIEFEHSDGEDNDDDYDSEPFDQKMIQESLAKKPAKSILKKRSVTEDESNNSRASTSESASTYKSLSDSEPETAPLHNADTRFLIKSDKDGILADFTGIYAPSTPFTDEQLELIEQRRQELGPFFPTRFNRTDALARYKLVKNLTEENDKLYWEGSASQKKCLGFIAARKRLNKDKVIEFYSKDAYLKQQRGTSSKR